MNFRKMIFYILTGIAIITYTAELNAENSGNIKITLNPSAIQNNNRKIAVFTFNTVSAGNYIFQGPEFADQCSDDLKEIGFDCIDREIISKAVREQSLNPNNPVSLKTALNIAKIIGADGVVLGQVIRIPGLFYATYRYLMKLVDVSTGDYVWAVDAADVKYGDVTEKLKVELNNIDRIPLPEN
ncbi:MAG: hypothetical protein JW864_18235 [Spirochaetes bacterium]|nr:hypothetical protein [Spirochaetota bacterium]